MCCGDRPLHTEPRLEDNGFMEPLDMSDSAAKILVLDDDPDILEVNRIVLQNAGYEVACFIEPAKAFEHMLRTPPDLVITDLMMGALDSGFSFVQRIRERPEFARLPVIIITAVGSQRGFDFMPRSEADLEAMQVQAFLAKPVKPRELQAKVAELLDAGRS